MKPKDNVVDFSSYKKRRRIPFYPYELFENCGTDEKKIIQRKIFLQIACRILTILLIWILACCVCRTKYGSLLESVIVDVLLGEMVWCGYRFFYERRELAIQEIVVGVFTLWQLNAGFRDALFGVAAGVLFSVVITNAFGQHNLVEVNRLEDKLWDGEVPAKAIHQAKRKHLLAYNEWLAKGCFIILWISYIGLSFLRHR